jgi:outer membrane receptor protein involved in Fe transport
LFVPPAVENVLISSAGLTPFLQDFPVPLPPLQPIRENQFELGANQPLPHGIRVAATGYFRDSKNPVHTILFPDSRIYAYANFDKGKAYGLETKLEVPLDGRRGLSGYINYAVGRVYFWNPVVAGFVDETHHLEESGRFLAPMDQTHTVTAGFLYRHPRGLWAWMSFEYGSGTPIEAEDEGEAAPLTPLRPRVPSHFTQDLTVGMDLLRHAERAKIGVQFNVENLTNNVYKVSQESVFSPGEYFHPRFFSASMKVHF